MARLAETSTLAIKDLAVKLIITIQITPLPSRSGKGSLQDDLFKLGIYVGSAQFKGKSFVKVFQEIERHGSDQLFSLLHIQVAMPPTVYNEPPIDTPFKSTSSSQRADEQTHDDLDERILQETNGCVYKDTMVSMRSISKESHSPRKPNKLSTK